MSRIVEPGPIEFARYSTELEDDCNRLREMLMTQDSDVAWVAKLLFDAEHERETEKARADSLQHLQQITQAKLEEARRGVAGATEIIARLEAKVHAEIRQSNEPTPAHEWESFDD